MGKSLRKQEMGRLFQQQCHGDMVKDKGIDEKLINSYGQVLLGLEINKIFLLGFTDCNRKGKKMLVVCS